MTRTGSLAVPLLSVAVAALGCARGGSPSAPTASAPTATAPAAPASYHSLGLSTPESVLYDAADDVYLVSNIGGDPTAADDDGFISRVSPDGQVLALRFIDGASPDVTLDAPKGSAIVGDRLFVADLHVLRVFDRVSGAPLGAVEIPGGDFVNDVAAASDGTLFVSDTALAGGTPAIYMVTGDTVEVLAEGPDTKQPNGLLADEGGVWVVTFGDKLLYHVGRDGTRGPAYDLPSGGLDGIVRLADGRVAVSSWEAGAVFVGRPGESFSTLQADLPTPADIGYDSKRGRILVPHFESGSLTWLTGP